MRLQLCHPGAQGPPGGPPSPPSESRGASAATRQALDRVDPASPCLASGARCPQTACPRVPGPQALLNSPFTLSQAG